MKLIRYFILAIPLLEIFFFIKVGGAVGAWSTILLILASAIIGIIVIRFQGMSVMFNARQRMNQGELPAIEMMHGAMLATAGGLLIIPGFLTDCIGFLLLVPAVRAWLMARFTFKSVQRSGQSSPSSGEPDKVLEGSYERHDDKQ